EAGEEQRLRRREEDRRKKGRRSLFSNEQDNENNSDALDPRKHSKRTWPVPWSAEKLQDRSGFTWRTRGVPEDSMTTSSALQSSVVGPTRGILWSL
ncbi:unnamed protein product, partial [Ascophyllum nodosum]